jgi:hypothetical protein
VRPAQARRLANRAGRHGWRGRAARRRLVETVSGSPPGSSPAIDALWAAWLDKPSDPVWTLLAGWRSPGTGPDADLARIALAGVPGATPVVMPTARGVLAAFDRHDHPVAAAARRVLASTVDTELVDAVCAVAATQPDRPLARFCVEHRLVPSEPVARVAFFVTTGQVEQFRAADPDGAALALAYAAADDRERERLRAGMVRIGELDLVRVIAGGGPELVSRASPAELEYLTGQLADRADWPGLWRVLVALSPDRAVGVWRLFPVDWRPAGSAARRLADALARVPATARAGIEPPYRLFRRQPLPPGHLADMSLSPTGDRLTLLVWRDTTRTVVRYRMPEGVRQRRYDLPGGAGGRLNTVLDLGGGSVLLAGAELARLNMERPAPLQLEDLGQAHVLARTPTGFAALRRSAGSLTLGSATGEVTSRLSLSHLAVATSRYWAFAADPETGRIAVAGERGAGMVLLLLDPFGALLASGQLAGVSAIESVRFTDPDELFSTGAAGPHAWWRDGDRLVARGTEHIPLVPAPRAGGAAGRVAPRLAPLLDPRATVRLSGDGRWVAVALDGQLQLYRFGLPGWLGSLLRRPIPGLTTADLATVPPRPPAGWRGVPGYGVAGAPALADLLLAALELRFGTEIELGGDLYADAYDIELSIVDSDSSTVDGGS